MPPHLACWLLALLCVSSLRAEETLDTVLRFGFENRRVEGRALVWEPQFAAVLERSGNCLQLTPGQAMRLETKREPFRPFTVMEMRRQLDSEFGPVFEIAGDARYVVVYPKGQRSQWAPRFEQL